MRCMVKLTELEEMVESLLGGTLGTSASAPPKDAVMDLDEDHGIQEEANVMT